MDAETPTSCPFTNQINVGDDPPLTAVAVKVTWVPAQTDVAEGVIEIETGKDG